MDSGFEKSVVFFSVSGWSWCFSFFACFFFPSLVYHIWFTETYLRFWISLRWFSRTGKTWSNTWCSCLKRYFHVTLCCLVRLGTGRKPSKKNKKFASFWSFSLKSCCCSVDCNGHCEKHEIGRGSGNILCSKPATKATELPVLDMNSNHWWLQYSAISDISGIFSHLHSSTTKIFAFQMLYFQRLILGVCPGHWECIIVCLFIVLFPLPLKCCLFFFFLLL